MHGRKIKRDDFRPSPPPAGLSSAGCCESARMSAPSQGIRQNAETPPPLSTSDPAPANSLPACIRSPGTRSSTSSRTPKSRLNSAQSSWVTPESCSTLNLPSTSRSGSPSTPAAICAFNCFPAFGVLFKKNPQHYVPSPVRKALRPLPPDRGSQPPVRRPSEFLPAFASHHPSPPLSTHFKRVPGKSRAAAPGKFRTK